MARHARVAGTLISLLVSAAAEAGAQTPPSVGEAAGTSALVLLRSPRCDARFFDADAFVQLLTIELLPAKVKLVRDELAASSAEMILEISAFACDPRARELTIAIAERRTGDRREHSIALYDVDPRTRPRALALAIAELLRQRRAEPGLQAAAPVRNAEEGRAPTDVEPLSPARPPASATPWPQPDPMAPVRMPHRPDLQLAPQGRLFAAESTLLVGVNLAASLPLGTEWLRGRADLGGHWAGLDDPLGRVNMGLYSGGLALLASAGDSPELFIGPHLELGYAYAAGKPVALRSEARDGGRVVLLASLMAGARFRTGRWAAAFELDLGTSLLGVEVFADDRRIAAMQGFFAGARAGIAYEY